jgi:hypothetical protein
MEPGEMRGNEPPEDAKAQGSAGNKSLRETFSGYHRPTGEEFDRLWADGMFVVDTNVLLNLYRYSRSTRDELLGVLRALQDKLFLPHQVGEEFLNRRLGTIRNQREGFSNLRKRVTEVRAGMEEDLRGVLRLRPGEELPTELRAALEEVPSDGYEMLAQRSRSLEEALPRASNHPGDDEVWSAVEELVDGKVGPPYGDEQKAESEEEAERRRDAKIPPGFKDKRPGDYVLWSQTIDEAKRSRRPVVLVTDDRKEDWWWIEHSETMGPRRELVAEMRKEAGVQFYMYTPDRLMVEARDRLEVEVSDESISEAEGLGREDGDSATSAVGESQPGYDEFIDSFISLANRERVALRAFVENQGYEGVAADLGVSHAEAQKLVNRAVDKINQEISERYPPAPGYREVNPDSTRRFIGRRNRSSVDEEADEVLPVSVADAAELLEVLIPLADGVYRSVLRSTRAEDLAKALNDSGYDRSLLVRPVASIYRAVTRALAYQGHDEPE